MADDPASAPAPPFEGVHRTRWLAAICLALAAEANVILQAAEALGGQPSFLHVAAALALVFVFGALLARGRRKRGYRAVRLVHAAAAVLLYALLPQAVHAQARPNERLRVLFLGDNGHHQPSARAKELLPALARNGIDLFYTASPADLNATKLARYHAVILYNNHPTIADAQLAALLSFVADGHGLAVIHCASASFQNSEEFIKLVGAAFKSHGTGTFRAVRTAPDHPALRGVPAFESWDETYIHTKHNPVGRTVLETRNENGHAEPWTWVKSYGKGRVFYTAWGHDQRTWTNSGFQQLVGQGLLWAMGDWALSHVARDPVTTMVDLAAPLPTYKRPPAPWNTLDTAITKAQAPLPAEQSLKMMTLLPGFSVTPFATEPMIGNVVDFAWDARGRMWAVETNDYPNVVLPDSIPGHDRILILEDQNGDGRADHVTVFADGLNLATSLAFAAGGVVVGQAPHMLFFRDTNGDDRADERTILFTGFPRGDTHGTISNLRRGFDNQVWGSVGYNGFIGTVGSTTYARGEFGSGYFRFPADGSTLEYMGRTTNNTWGVGFTEDGYVFGSTANRRPTQFLHIPIRYYRALGQREPFLADVADRADIYPQIEIFQVDQFGLYTAGAGHEIYTARAFPPEHWNRTAFISEPTGHLIGMFTLSEHGSGFRATNRWNFMVARDAWVAPVQAKVGPDGALWVADFYSLVAQHNPTPESLGFARGPGNAYETPNRDRLHGRIYRIAYDSAPARRPMRLDRATPDQLVQALTNDNLFWRMTAQRLLVERGRQDVVPALVALVNTHTVDGLGLNPGALHALWTLHGLDALARDSSALLAARNALYHPAGSVRRAALMTLPREPRLLDDIFAAGMLPDRQSPWPVEYTVGTGILQDADAHVRLEALLVLSELPPSDRATAALRDVILHPPNARDDWIPDAVAIAGARQGVEFLADLVRRPLPAVDSLAVAGVQRAVRRMAAFQASSKAVTTAVRLISAVPAAAAPVATALLDGMAEGWPEEQPPMLTSEQRTALGAAARGAPEPVAASFAKVAARWGMPDLFRSP
jgi:putative membrane-bound dehydrogenase-like protein